VTDAEIDAMLAKAARRAPPTLDAALLGRIADSLRPSLRPVKPVPPGWMRAIGLVLVCVAVALAGAGGGIEGLEDLSLPERILILTTLGLLTLLMARELVSSLTPGSRHYLRPGRLLALASFTLLGVFALLFHDYRLGHYAVAGYVCLRIGLLYAIPVAVLGWLLLRRGFAVNSVSTGLLWGALAGLGGVAVLVLRCDNFQAVHVLVWHVGVVPLSAAAGAAIGWLVARIPPRRGYPAQWNRP
jgi:hypothetical protein